MNNEDPIPLMLPQRFRILPSLSASLARVVPIFLAVVADPCTCWLIKNGLIAATARNTPLAKPKAAPHYPCIAPNHQNHVFPHRILRSGARVDQCLTV